MELQNVPIQSTNVVHTVVAGLFQLFFVWQQAVMLIFLFSIFYLHE